MTIYQKKEKFRMIKKILKRVLRFIIIDYGVILFYLVMALIPFIIDMLKSL